jgi:c-di-GMP phosphodiesterase Gmr
MSTTSPTPPAHVFVSLENASPEETLCRARLEAARSARPVAAEYTVGTNGAARTFLTTYKAVFIGGEKRLVSATLDITEGKGAARRRAELSGHIYGRRADLQQRLHAAVDERRFRPAFQPKVSIDSGKVVGFEALARWVDDDGTIHLPGTFIGLATEVGLLNNITEQVLEHVIASIPTLQSWHGTDVSVSLNVSARQVDDRAFFHAFLAQLAESSVADSIILELTEDALVAAHRFQHTVLPTLRGLGVRVSIDDFGTGYSSLSTLADITADEVKVDRAFITSIHTRGRSQGILRAIESLCSALDVAMVAEGIETEEELAYLRSHSSIQSAQGYLFGKPQFLESCVR